MVVNRLANPDQWHHTACHRASSSACVVSRVGRHQLRIGWPGTTTVNRSEWASARGRPSQRRRQRWEVM